MEAEQESKLVLGCIILVVLGVVFLILAGGMAGWYAYHGTVTEPARETPAPQPGDTQSRAEAAEAMAAAIRDTADREERTLPDMPVTLRPQPAGRHNYRIRPDRVTITVAAKPEIMASLDTSQVICYIDTTRRDFLTNPCLSFAVPDQVRVYSVRPYRVTIEQ